MDKVFLDSSALIAYLREKDSCHQKAVIIWEKLKTSRTIFVLTNYIFAEFLTVIRQKIGIKAAIKSGELIRQGKIFERIWIDELLEEKAWGIFKKSKIKDLSFVDCTSFASMRYLKINKVFTFDRHFAKMGFVCL